MVRTGTTDRQTDGSTAPFRNTPTLGDGRTINLCDIQGAPIKSSTNLLPITHEWFKLVNFVIFRRSIESSNRHIFAELYFATANHEKDTVN